MFEPFTGVGPQRYNDLFAMNSTRWSAKKRKEKDGKKVLWEREQAELRNPLTVFNYMDAEKNAVMSFEDVTVALKEKNENE